MREHGTHACYVHGPDGPADSSGCRCEPCRAAAAAYERERNRRTAPPYVGSSRARDHVKMLQAQGMGWQRIARAAGISPSVVCKLLYGDRQRGQAPTKRIRRATEQAILAVTLDLGDAALVDSAQCRADVAALLARGWSKAAISAGIGQNGRTLQIPCLSDPSKRVQAGTARKVHALLDQPVQTKRTRYGTRVAAPPVEPLDELDEQRRRAAVERQQETAPTIDPAIFDAEWRRRAACRFVPDEDLWIFWPPRGDRRALDAALAVCRTCPVASDCLAYALEAGEVGVWGGTSEVERERMLGRRVKKGAAA